MPSHSKTILQFPLNIHIRTSGTCYFSLFVESKMSSGGKFSEALKYIIDDLNENQINDENIEAIEAENKQLREKKMELMAKLNPPTTSSVAAASIVVVKDMILRQRTLNQIRSESKKNSELRLRDRSQESNSQTSTWKETLEDVDIFRTLPYHDVLQKNKEMDDKIAENCFRIKELKEELAKLTQNQNEQSEADEAEDIRFIEILRCVVEEQRKLIEKHKEISRVNKTNGNLL